jgi:hypothetical protein
MTAILSIFGVKRLVRRGGVARGESRMFIASGSAWRAEPRLVQAQVHPPAGL